MNKTNFKSQSTLVDQCLTLLGGIVVPASKLSPDADMIVDERTTYKSKLYQMEQDRSIVFSNKKPNLTLGASILGETGSIAGGKEAACGEKDQLVKIQIFKNVRYLNNFTLTILSEDSIAGRAVDDVT